MARLSPKPPRAVRHARSLRARRLSLLAIVTAGALAVGSCAGALAGNFTVTGGMYPRSGFAVPNFGSEAETARLPAATSIPRAEPAAQSVGYYPVDTPVMSSPETAHAAEREFDRLYDNPAFTEAKHMSTSTDDDWPAAAEPSADVAAYSAAEDADGAAD